MCPLPKIKDGNEDPIFNIGVVARMTGISMATLRAWERRYDFPESGRTAGGHRLYSEKDVLRLQWVKDRIGEGMQTGRAIYALRHQEDSGNIVQPEAPISTRSEEPLAPVRTHLSIYRDHLYDLLIQHDLQGADSLLGEALAVLSPDELILDVIGPVIALTGDYWEEGNISIADEHFATNYLRQRLLMWMMSGPPPRRNSPILLACAPDEWHEGGLLILGALLRRRQWPVVYLGQSLPLADLASIVRELNPAMIAVVAMTETTAHNLVDWPQHMPGVLQSGLPLFGYGGRVYVEHPEWRLRTPGLYLGDDFRKAIDMIERTIG